jgi:cytochrome c oxidase cbb3-type subunit 3/ubiquinol-cytochrome c reductase cytochrome c subunit
VGCLSKVDHAMKHLLQFALLLCAVVLAGCLNAPGKPAAGSEAKRPDQVLDFPTLYQENCSACHGDHGKGGAAISLANPAYLSFAGAANLARITANGVPGTMMPTFSQKSGGVLTDEQIQVLTQGMLKLWSEPSQHPGVSSIPFLKTLQANSTKGASQFAAMCSSCHGADGAGTSATTIPTGSLIDPSYLSLISDQGLRSVIVAGHSNNPFPNMTDGDVTDIVSWLVSHRTLAPKATSPVAPVVSQRRPQ